MTTYRRPNRPLRYSIGRGHQRPLYISASVVRLSARCLHRAAPACPPARSICKGLSDLRTFGKATGAASGPHGRRERAAPWGGEARPGNGPGDRFRAERAEPKARPGLATGRGQGRKLNSKSGRQAIHHHAEVLQRSFRGRGLAPPTPVPARITP